MATLTPAVSYLRMSKDSQESSIPAQRDAVADLAKRLGYRIIREYRDEGISGDNTEKRTAFLQMRRDASDLRDFKAILCWDQDRFGRFDTLECGYWVKPIRDAGVELVTVAQGKISWSDFAGRISYLIQQDAKHQFLIDLSRNSNRGKLKKAMDGEWMGGLPAIGYRIGPNRRLVIEESEAAIVREIFRKYINGVALIPLARELNTMGLRTATGGLFSPGSVRRILINEVYLGKTIFNRKSAGKYTSMANGMVIQKTSTKQQQNDQSLWVVLENTHPPIVTQELFDAAQKSRLSHKNFAGKHDRVNVFRGLIKCGYCGHSMPAMYVPGSRDTAYQCNEPQRGRDTPQNRAYQKDLIELVRQAFASMDLSAKGISKLKSNLLAKLSPQNDDRPSVASLEAQKAKTRKKLEASESRLLEVESDMVKIVTSQIRELRAQIASIEDQIESLSIPAATLNASVKTMVDELVKSHRQTLDAIASGDYASLTSALRASVSKIIVWSTNKPKHRVPQGRYQIDKIEIVAKNPEISQCLS